MNCVIQLPQLIDDHYQLVYRYAYRLSSSAQDAEDLTQQTFLTAHQKLHQLREPDRAGGWLCRIVRNTFLRTRPHGRAGVVPLEGLPEPAEGLEADSDFDVEELQRAISQLAEEFRTPLVLFYFEQFSYREIAEQMDIPIGTVMSRLARAKAWLRERLAASVPELRLG